jgi:serine/threonine protein kinase
MNNLTNEEKLQMAIEISEGIAEQHGCNKGIMMNDDIELKQWLQRKRKIVRRTDNNGRDTYDNSSKFESSIFLNDLGNTIFRSFHNESQNYCEMFVQYGGDFKAPEEFQGTYVDESADVWPIGNIIYTLLTGLHPYYNISSTWKKQLELIWNATQTYVPYINPHYYNRSYIEHEMINVMKACHQHDPINRITIFDVIKRLHKIKHIHQQTQRQIHEQRNKYKSSFLVSSV